MKNSIVVSLVFLVTCVALPADARKPFRNAFFGLYGSATGTVLDDVASNSGHCGLCHFDFNGGGTRNLYGLSVEAAIKSGNYPSTEAAIQSVENIDSDNDGFLNIFEITDPGHFGNVPTFPGVNDEVLGWVSNVNLAEIQTYLSPSGPTETTPPTVTVTSPNGGENVQAGNVVTVTWTATDASGVSFVNIYLSDDGGSNFKPVAVREPNDGTFDWFVPNLPGAQSIIRVTARDNAGNYGSDWSDAVFTLTGVTGGRVPTTLRDMDLPGTQPFKLVLDDPDATCVTCHGNYDSNVEPWYQWKGSMMAHAMRDPLFLACLAVAEQDAPSVGDLCLRCHTPGGWAEGRSVDTGGGLLNAKDRQGVQCDFCHRLADPVYEPGVSPPEDLAVLDSTGTLPLAPGTGQFVMDPDPMRRGPFNDAGLVHSTLTSPYHSESDLCGICHDVSNPVFVVGSGPRDYVPNDWDTPHPDGDQSNMLPIERTYSEWSVSEYATTGVFAPQFAGNKPDGIVSSCQDCHMRDVSGKGADESGVPTREDLPLHDMTGGNTCVPDMVAAMYPGEVDVARLEAGKQRAEEMLQKAASLALAPGQEWLPPAELAYPTLAVTVTNETAHKLPSGYPEGRRIWLNVKAWDSNNTLVYESGHYDPATGELEHDADLKIYEIHPGLSPDLASALSLPAGKSFHFVLNDTIYEDNRIPPRGFTNANFETIQSPPVAYTYADGQYWDETNYNLPPEAAFAEVTLYYQATSKEYVEFLRDENVTNSAGLDLYNVWVSTGRCPPVAMVSDTTSLTVVSGVDDTPPLLRTALEQNTPNPFSASTVIPYSLESRQHVSIKVYDVKGRLIRTVVDEVRPAGIQKIEWDGTNAYGELVASGVYFYRMQTAGQHIIRKALMLR